MKQKAFTLVELLGVISILAILALITAVPITKLIKNSNQKACASQMDTIVTAAKLWGKEHIDALPTTIGTSITITLATLKQNGYVEASIQNPIDKADFADTMSIKITKKGQKYWTYKIVGADTLCGIETGNDASK